MDYTQLSAASRLNMVQQRIRDIETQYMSLQLRVEAPDASMPISEMDAQNLAMLEASLDKLHQMEKELQNSAGAS